MKASELRAGDLVGLSTWETVRGAERATRGKPSEIVVILSTKVSWREITQHFSVTLKLFSLKTHGVHSKTFPADMVLGTDLDYEFYRNGKMIEPDNVETDF